MAPTALECGTAQLLPVTVNQDACAGASLHNRCGESCGLCDCSIHLLCCPNLYVTAQGNLLCQGLVGCAELPHGCVYPCCPGGKSWKVLGWKGLLRVLVHPCVQSRAHPNGSQAAPACAQRRFGSLGGWGCSDPRAAPFLS